jgi:hypothetical protein
LLVDWIHYLDIFTRVFFSSHFSFFFSCFSFFSFLFFYTFFFYKFSFASVFFQFKQKENEFVLARNCHCINTFSLDVFPLFFHSLYCCLVCSIYMMMKRNFIQAINMKWMHVFVSFQHMFFVFFPIFYGKRNHRQRRKCFFFCEKKLTQEMVVSHFSRSCSLCMKMKKKNFFFLLWTDVSKRICQQFLNPQ